MGIRINALTETTSPGDTDNGVLDTSAGTRRITWSNIKTAIFGAINGLTSKSTPVGADVIAIGDSAASFAGKKATLMAAVNGALTGWTVAWDTITGAASTDTKIAYFTNKNTDTSSGDLTIVNNSTNGLRLTIVSDGLYAMGFWLVSTGANLTFGISLNSSQLTTDIESITAVNRLALATSATNLAAMATATRRLSAGDVIRAHTGGGGGAATNAFSGFFITRIR